MAECKQPEQATFFRSSRSLVHDLAKSPGWQRLLVALRRYIPAACIAVLAACGGGDDTPSVSPASRQLAIAPIAQRTPVWCWAASAEMVFRYYQMPSVNPSDYQCGIIATVYGGQCAFNCGLCVTPIGAVSNMQMVINGYGYAVQAMGVNSRVLTSRLIFSALTFDDLRTEIASGRPILIGFAPSGGYALPNGSQHFGLITGYDATRSDVIVIDPYPYAATGTPDPYTAAGAAMLQPGEYRVPYSTLVQRLAWVNTVYGIQ